MEPEGSLQYSQVPATCPYPEPTPSIPHDPLQLINWLVFITETECVYCAVRTGSLCVLCGSENKQRLFPFTALTDWFL
jgi:hypothetical protein